MRPIRATLSTFLFCLGLVFSAGFISTAWAGTVTAVVGDPKGTNFKSECDDGQALVGVGYFLGQGAVNSILAICMQLDGGGNPVGRPILLDEKGPPSAGGRSDSRCPLDMVVEDVSVYLGANNRVHHLRLSCHVANGENKKGVLVGPTQSPGGPETSHKSVGCPSGHATGIAGSYKLFLNSLGLICQTAEAEEPVVDDDTGGEQRTVKEPTTVYDAQENGGDVTYLDRGDKVTIIECPNGDGAMCHISAPEEGWVYGGDLD